MRWGIVAVACLSACGSSGTSGLDHTEAAALRECARGLATLDSVEPPERVWHAAETCAGAQPSFARLAVARPGDRVALLADEADLLCKPDARTALGEMVGQRMPALVRACGADYYGLPADATWMLSSEWFVIQRVGAWLTEIRARAEHSHPDLVRELDANMARAVFSLELPVRIPGLYTLPRAHQHAPVHAAAFVLIAHQVATIGGSKIPTSELRVGAMPQIGFDRGGAKLVRTKGHVFPGKVVELEQLRAELSWVSGDEQVVILADGDHPAKLVQDVATHVGELTSVVAVDGYGAERAAAAKLPLRKRTYVKGALVVFKMDSMSVSSETYGEHPIAKSGKSFDWDHLKSRLRFVAGYSPGDSAAITIRDMEARVSHVVKAMDLLAETRKSIDVDPDAEPHFGP